jgi:hypothetical protein
MPELICINKNCEHWSIEIADCSLFKNCPNSKPFCENIITDKMTVVDDKFFAES